MENSRASGRGVLRSVPPGELNLLDEKVASKAFGAIAMKGMEAKGLEDHSFAVRYFTWSPEMKSQKAEGQLKALLTYFEKEAGQNPTIKKKTKITLNKYAGYEVESTCNGVACLLRCYVTARRAFVITVERPT